MISEISSPLQFSNDLVSLLEWFLLSVAIVVVVTLVYVFVLSRSPPPEGVPTVAQLEIESQRRTTLDDPGAFLERAQQQLANNDYSAAVDSSSRAVSLSLLNLLSKNGELANEAGMGMSDMAYLLESKKSGAAPQFSPSVYQLSSLRLRAIRSESIAPQEAAWAVSFAAWFVNSIARS